MTGRILGIETSCDETSVAIVDRGGRVSVNLIASQIERHRPFGGVVPEIASREHLQHLMPLVRQGLDQGGVELRDLEGIAVTVGPGLIGALLVGVSAAQGISYGSGIPLYRINHLEGHIASSYLQRDAEAVPRPERFLSLVVSGGHSSIYDVRPGSGAVTLNRTRDDAAGEVFDKVAKFVGFPYPGGPHVEKASAGGDPDRFDFPAARFRDGSADFSFSGLKAMAIRTARKHDLQDAAAGGEITPVLSDFCAGLQKAIVDQLIDRLSLIWNGVARETQPPSEVAVAGGVAANGYLRKRALEWGEAAGLPVRLPEKVFCTDNAAMIAFAAIALHQPQEAGEALRVPAHSRMQVGAR